MPEPPPSGSPAAARAVGGVRRLRDAWGRLAAQQRVCGVAALGLLATMVLPWYSGSRPVVVRGRAQTVSDSHTALFVFSWVEAAVLLVALGVLALLFARGERRAFHLPGGDGTVIAAAGAWVFLLIVWRLFDKPDLGRGVTAGLQWGIFVGLVAAAALAAAGNRLRASGTPEPVPERAVTPAAPGEPVEVAIPEERPHLEPTQVIPRRREDETAEQPRLPGMP